MSKIVRISEDAYQKLGELSKRKKKSMQLILDEALEKLVRHELFERANQSYARLRADEKAWKEELQERADWEATLGDGLEE